MKKFLAAIFLAGIVCAPPAHVQAASSEELRYKINHLLEQVLVLREQIRQIALTEPVEATLAVAGRKQVALQAGHWKLENVPWELRGLLPSKQAQGAGYMEWEVNLAIAEKTAEILEEKEIDVSILPSILPGIYRADAFVAIHADQNPSLPKASGFKVAASAFDKSGKAAKFANLMSYEYRHATWLNQKRYIPPSMPYYYAFNSEKFLYAIHPETPAVIIETGYLPNPRDRAVILSNPQWAAQGIANAILKFLEEE